MAGKMDFHLEASRDEATHFFFELFVSKNVPIIKFFLETSIHVKSCFHYLQSHSVILSD